MSSIIPVIFAISLFMENVDTTILATSLPNIAESFQTSPLSLKLALTSYLISLSIFIPISGWLVDRFTAKRVFIVSLIFFTLGSLFCALSNNLLAFVLARFLQGTGAAMMTPVGRILLIKNTQKNKLIAVMAWVTVPAMIGPLLGPLLGGIITDLLSWHFIFLVNIPIALICLIIAILYMPNDPETSRQPLDSYGFILSTLALSSFLFGSSILGMSQIPLWVSCPIFLSGIYAAYLYYRYTQKAETPLLNLKLFYDHTFRQSILSAIFFRIGIGAMPFITPLMLQLFLGYTSTQTGILLAAGALGALLSKISATFIFSHISFRSVLMIGTALSSLTISICGFFTTDTSFWLIASILFFGGLVRSICFTAINTLAYENISSQQTSQAITLANVFQQASFASGVAIAAILLETSSYTRNHNLILSDFKFAFIGVGLISFMAAIGFSHLNKNAGHSFLNKK